MRLIFDLDKPDDNIGQMTCEKQAPKLRGYNNWPELFRVGPDYCKTK